MGHVMAVILHLQRLKFDRLRCSAEIIDGDENEMEKLRNGLRFH
jgi:hypothetical protein